MRLMSGGKTNGLLFEKKRVFQKERG